jgi:hypothetical protein
MGRVADKATRWQKDQIIKYGGENKDSPDRTVARLFHLYPYGVQTVVLTEKNKLETFPFLYSPLLRMSQCQYF